MVTNKKYLLYLSHPSGGLDENRIDIEKSIRTLYKNNDIYNNFCIVSPVHCYGFMYNDNSELDYDYKGLSYCTDLLMHCDIMLVIGDWENSIGCTDEIEKCKDNSIPYLMISNSDLIENEIKNDLANKLLEMLSNKR